MKKIIISLVLLLIFIPASGFAQGRFMFGFNGGINIRNLYQHDLTDGSYSSTKRIVYPVGGIEFGYFNWDRFSYRAQIFFDQSSIEIVPLLTVPVTHGEWKAYVFAGPAVTLVTGEYRDFFYEVGSSDYGIYGGAGISHSLSKKTDLFCQVSYDYGLKNVAFPPNLFFIYPGEHFYKQYTRILRIYFGILFGGL